MGFFMRRIACSFVSRARILAIQSCRCSTLAPAAEQQQPPPQDATQEHYLYSNTEQGYEAWWREWKVYRTQLPKVSPSDIISSEGTVVMDANIGSLFARMVMIHPAPPHRKAFHNMLMSLIEKSKLSAPPKLLHKYSLSNQGAQRILIPYAKITEGDKRVIGTISQSLVEWIEESKFVTARNPRLSVDFVVTMLQCAFLYKSTILLTNNKDYYYFTKIAKEINGWLAENFPKESTLLDVESVRLVYVLEQMGLDLYKVDLKPERKFPPMRRSLAIDV